jgi:endonuclease/exonuclease/phosphatase family metal-dependent hydrolase
MTTSLRGISARRYGSKLAGLILAIGTLLILSPRPASAFDPLAGDYSRDDALDIRVVSYNTHQDFIEDPSRDATFNRILTAIAPDIICFQEFTSATSASEVVNRMNSILPLSSASWQVHFGLLAGVRTAIVSRFPLTEKRTDTIPASATRGVTLALADLPDADYSMDVYLLGVHLKCCGDPGGSEDESRQDSADAIANWLGDARGVSRPSGDNITLPTDTPMIALGDFNLVGGPQPEDTLITGDIQGEGTYGPDVKGDWDNSDMTDLTPTDPFTGDDFTWQGSAYYDPSRLDRFFYTDSAVTVANSFILNTDTMTPAALSAAGLQAGDTLPENSSDHLPIAMDLRMATTPECVDNADCDDGLFCNGQETCNAQSQCEAGTPPDLADGVGCTIDTCDEATDTIVHTPDDSACDNGLYCDGAETCDAVDDCQPGVAPDPDDGVDCTIDTCDEATDTVVHTPDDSFCDDGDPCNGTEVCNIGIGACESVIPDAEEILIDENFDSSAGVFSYQDDTFRGTSNPAFADGSYEPTGGATGGGLRVQVGGNSTDMSGGWVAVFDITGTPTSVEVAVTYRLLMDGGYESDEYAEALLSVDGTLIGVAPNDYLARFTGDGNSPADDMDSGWVTEVFSLALSGGVHELAIGGYNNKGTTSAETTEIFFDDVKITALFPGESDSDTDGILDSCDNCPLASNPGQEDSDADGVGDACDLCPATIPNATVDADGCPPEIAGDFDRDGDVDLSDYGAFLGCYNGPGQPSGAGCIASADYDGDEDVDLSDYGVFLGCYNGPENPPAPGC